MYSYGHQSFPFNTDLAFYCYELQSMAKLDKDLCNSNVIDKFKNTYSYLENIML